MKKVNPLPPKIGYYLGSAVVFIAWFFQGVVIGWHVFLRFLNLEHERQKQGFRKLNSQSHPEAERWFFGDTSSTTLDQSFARQNLSGDA